MQKSARRIVFLLVTIAAMSVFCSSAIGFSPIPQPSARVLAVAFSPDGRLLVSGGWDGTARVWKVGSGKPVKVLDFQHGPVRGLCFDPTGHVLAACGDVIKLWDTIDWRRIRVVKSDLAVFGISFDTSENKLIAGGMDGLTIWDSSTGRFWWHKDGDFLCMSTSADGRQAVCGDWDGDISLWDLSSKKRVFSLHANELDLRNTTISPGGLLIATGGWGKSAGIWDVPSQKLLYNLPTTGGPGEVPVVFSPDGKLLAYGCADGSVRIYNLTEKKNALILKGHKDDIGCLAFSPDGKLLASGGDDGLVMLWDVATGKRLYILRGHKLCLPSRG